MKIIVSNLIISLFVSSYSLLIKVSSSCFTSITSGTWIIFCWHNGQLSPLCNFSKNVFKISFSLFFSNSSTLFFRSLCFCRSSFNLSILASNSTLFFSSDDFSFLYFFKFSTSTSFFTIDKSNLLILVFKLSLFSSSFLLLCSNLSMFSLYSDNSNLFLSNSLSLVSHSFFSLNASSNSEILS